jgi:hypothetical protein
MEIQKMKNLIASVLFACVCVGPVLAASPEARAAGPSDVDTLEQFERDFGDALVAVDIDKVNQILADDWETIGTSGKIFTKQSVIRDLKSGTGKLEWFALGPVDVQVFGNVARAPGRGGQVGCVPDPSLYANTARERRQLF